jgi:hypothetical protein
MQLFAEFTFIGNVSLWPLTKGIKLTKECAFVYAELPCSRGAIVAVLPQRLVYEYSFHLFESYCLTQANGFICLFLLKLCRQALPLYYLGLTEHKAVFDDIFKLTDIAGIFIFQKYRQYLICHAGNVFIMEAIKPADKMVY